MKKMVLLALAVLAVSLICLSALGEGFVPGEYTATVHGMQGNFSVAVTFGENESITAINVGANKETAQVGSEGLRIMQERILASQSLGVDTVSGATVSSAALLSGVIDCAKQAGADVAALRAVPNSVDVYDDRSNETDILVVGGGIAGLSTALTAVRDGGDVILLEACDFVGGDSVLASGLYHIGGTEAQKENGITDDLAAFEEWLLKKGKDPVQVAVMAPNGVIAEEFLNTLGIKFGLVSNTAGSDIARTHRVSGGMVGVVGAIKAELNERNADVSTGLKAVGYLTDAQGAVVGVKAEDRYGAEHDYYAKSIVLACGGFANNADLIAESWGEEYRSLVFGGTKNLDGAMLLAARDTLGAQMITMDNVRMDTMHETRMGLNVLTSAVSGSGAIMVSQTDGKRFFDEMANNSGGIKDNLFAQPDHRAALIWGENALQISEKVAQNLNNYVDNGMIRVCETAADAAKLIGVDVSALQATLDECGAVANGAQEDAFGRAAETFFGGLQAPYYVMTVASGVGTTHGGFRVDEQMRVIGQDDQPIERLYAVGECVGGYLVSYVGGDSLARGTVTGVLLGHELAKNER